MYLVSGLLSAWRGSLNLSTAHSYATIDNP